LGRVAFVLVLLAAGSRPPVRAETVAALSALKAAYTFHFLNLVRWEHPLSSSSLEVCVFGDSDTGDQMYGSLHDRTVNGQAIHVRRIPSDTTRAERCDAIYIPDVHRERAAALLAIYDHSATLTISDIPRFVGLGGVIGFAVVDGRLRFDINERAAAKKKLRISAKLLELAREVMR
jgi:hypothetical protein